MGSWGATTTDESKPKYLTDEDDITIIDTPAGEVGQTGKFKSNFINDGFNLIIFKSGSCSFMCSN